MVSIRRMVAVAACVAAMCGRRAHAQSGRPLTVDDVLRLEELGAVVPSPDGKYVAIEVARPMSDAARVHMTTFDARPRTDVWIVRLSDGSRHQVTRGRLTGSGWFGPVWSPDGKRLALLSTEGCTCIRAWTWRLGDREPRLVDSRNVDYWVFASDRGQVAELRPLTWLDPRTLLVPLLPAGERSHVDLVAEAESATISGWQAARAGKVSTASVLQSTPGHVQPYMRNELIVVHDVERRVTRVVATIPRDPSTSGRRSIVVSPDHRRIAVLTSSLQAPINGQRLRRTMSPYALGFINVTGGDSVRWVGDVINPDSLSDAMPVLAWMPNGEAVVLRGSWHTDGAWQFGWWRIDASTGGAAAARACPAAVHGCTAQQDANAARALTVVADTGLYRAEPGDGHLVDVLPTSLRQPKLHLAQLGSAEGSGDPCVVATVGDAAGRMAAYRLDVSSAAVSVRALGAVPAGYRLEGCMPHTGGVILVRRDRAVAMLAGGRFSTLLRINDWSDAIAEPQKVFVRYRAADGDSLGAVLLLPPERRKAPNAHYPLVVWVYAEATFEDTAQVRDDHAWSSPYNLALLTAQGFAVLYPSIPLWPAGGEGGDVASHLSGAVLPAIDRVGALGMVDTSRVAVMGQSFGGWTTLALITRTQRFRSAIAMAVVSDLVSYSGTFRAWDRPWPYAHIVMAPEKIIEAGQQRLGGSLWQYPARYVSNSPVFQANRVETPTMIIQGDQDFEGVQQAEEFFNALQRLGKRAELVRYVGDTHAIESPANVRDMWERIMAWLSTTMDTQYAPHADSIRAAPN